MRRDWTSVAIPDTTDTVNGVLFTVTPVPDSDLNEVRASLPSSNEDRIFIRLVGEAQ